MSKNFLFLELEGETIAQLIAAGEVSFEEMEKTKDEYAQFLTNLNIEWPAERVKEFILAELRRKCEWCVKRTQEIEFENRDARTKGVSFKDRQKYSKQLEELKKLFHDLRAKGVEYSKQNLLAQQFVTPIHAQVILSDGFEKYLKLAII